MNQIFAWLLFIGIIVGIYTGLHDPLQKEADAKTVTDKKSEEVIVTKRPDPVVIEFLDGWDKVVGKMDEGTTATIGMFPPPSKEKGETPPPIVTRLGYLSEKGKKIGEAIIKMPEAAVNILIGLIGPMALWLGIMKIAEDAGLIRLLAIALQPILRPLFPRIPRGHPAMGAMILNIAANVLGTGNAATPLGLKAMNELQKLNKEKDTATDAMIMFLAINTSSVTLIPFTTAAYRASAGSKEIYSFILPTIVATFCSTAVAIIAVTFFKRFSKAPADYYDEFAEEMDRGSSIDEVYQYHLQASMEKEQPEVKKDEEPADDEDKKEDE